MEAHGYLFVNKAGVAFAAFGLAPIAAAAAAWETTDVGLGESEEIYGELQHGF